MNRLQSLALAPLFLLLFSCQELFTTSLAAPLARTPSQLYGGLTTAALADPVLREEIIDSLEGNPASVAALLDQLEALSESASGLDAVILAGMAVEAAGDALNLSGVLPVVLAALSNAPEGEEPDIAAILEDAFAANTALEGAAESLLAILPTSADSDWNNFVAIASDDALIFAGLTLLMGQALEAPDFIVYVEDFDAGSASLDPAETLAVDLLYAALGSLPNSILEVLMGQGEEEGGID